VLNPTSLVKPSALQQLATELTQFNIGVAIITETWFNDRHIDQFVNIAGYDIHRKDRLNKKGGGVAIYVRNDIRSKIITPRTDNQPKLTEVLRVECDCKDTVYYIAACYHPPIARYCDSVLKSELCDDLESLLTLSASLC
jgi:hypothetical protein